jgi:hypothetical protein
MLSVNKIVVNLLEQLWLELEVSVKQLGSRAEIGTRYILGGSERGDVCQSMWDCRWFSITAVKKSVERTSYRNHRRNIGGISDPSAAFGFWARFRFVPIVHYATASSEKQPSTLDNLSQVRG